MALFLAKEPPHCIMLLGRWKSCAILDYIPPQVLEWSTNLATIMNQFNHFWDLSQQQQHPKGQTPRTLQMAISYQSKDSAFSSTIIVSNSGDCIAIP